MITKEALAQRVIPFASLKASTDAFIDYRIPGCGPKYNYALIGPGVSQNPNQPVSLREHHGFQVGGVGMPPGVTNPPHMHFTCEVFLCTRGRWQLHWGFNPEASTADFGEGDICTVPTWVYRGFKNIGPDDGFMFTALGGDDTGGILWGPTTLAAAAKEGVHLTDTYQIIDEQLGQRLEPGMKRLQPMTAQEIAALRTWSPQEMARRIVRFADLQWSTRSLLDSALPGCGASLAPVIGLGITQDRDHLAPVSNAHGLSIEWLKIPVGGQVSSHRLPTKQVLIVKSGTLEVEVQTLEGPARHTLVGGAKGWDSISLPQGAWRSLHARGTQSANATQGDVLAMLLTPGDQRKPIEWAEPVVQAAAAQGLTTDVSGFVAPKTFVDRSQR
jgi:quercetin dioxygenase-like cupin family protein